LSDGRANTEESAMSDQSLHSDLAFMRAVADDRGPMPRTIGEHMLVPGLVFGANFALIWAAQAGLFTAPGWFNGLAWAPGAVIYLLCWPVLWKRAQGSAIGPAARAFAAVWCAVAVMTLAFVGFMVVASYANQKPYFETWPASAFILYGGAWAALAVVRRSWGWAAVAAGSFATAIAAAAVLLHPAAYLIMAIGLVLVVALPGLAIIRRAAR
jgi:hypothetical protein